MLLLGQKAALESLASTIESNVDARD